LRRLLLLHLAGTRVLLVLIVFFFLEMSGCYYGLLYLFA
jgi:hypothetical protein